MSSTSCELDRVEATRLGVHRSLEPRGTLAHIAQRLDAATPANDYEAELDVRRLAVDSTSFRVIRERCQADPQRMAGTIAQIVYERGKLQNPWTGSGGVLLGCVAHVGERRDDLAPGESVVPLASLVTIPLALDAVGPVDPADHQVPVRGRAIVTGAMPCARMPSDLTETVALNGFDVYPVASHVRALAAPGAHVLVLGSGQAGLLGLAAARAAVGPSGTVSAIDVSAEALARARAVEPDVNAVAGDVTDPVLVAGELTRRGFSGADLTLVCTSVAGAEGAALLATDPRGTVLFFSTATQFSAAALGADAVGSQAHLVIPNGLTDDRGDYTFELLRSNAPLRAAFGGHG
jgi:L-erythro-3,5-diaminohexanoate dehydrogenase